MNIVFFGSSHFVIPVLEKLLSITTISLVITTEKEENSSVISFCKKNNLAYISTQILSDPQIISQLKKVEAKVAFLASFGLLVPEDIINLFPYGIINIHPSLLPKYRGPTPVQTALFHGETKTGVTIIKLDNKLDHGPILAQEVTSIEPDETAEKLHLRLFNVGANLLIPLIERMTKNEPLAQAAQNQADATFTEHLTRESGFFDIQNPPKNLQHMIAAYYPWPGVWSKIQLNGKEVRIKFLPEQKVQIEGKKPVSNKDFANGYPEASFLFENLKLKI